MITIIALDEHAKRLQAYAKAKADCVAVERRMAQTKKELVALGANSGPGGLTPDKVKAMPKYIRLNNRQAADWALLRKLNAATAKEFAAEIKQERRDRQHAVAAYREMEKMGRVGFDVS